MPAPTNSPWAYNTLNDLVGTVPGEGTFVYSNKTQPSLEVQANGALLGVSIPFQHINYQFDMIYQNIEYLKNPEQGIVTEATTARTLVSGDRAKHIRFTNGSSTTYTFNQGVATVGTKIVIRQAGAGVVTINPGSGVTLLVPTGKAPKTSGINTTFTAIKVSEGSGIESWDLYGELGT